MSSWYFSSFGAHVSYFNFFFQLKIMRMDGQNLLKIPKFNTHLGKMIFCEGSSFAQSLKHLNGMSLGGKANAFQPKLNSHC